MKNMLDQLYGRIYTSGFRQTRKPNVSLRGLQGDRYIKLRSDGQVTADVVNL